jgi:pimeloyl-ACP methyl ester carboxylesterase
VDFVVARGTQVRAAGAGVVSFAGTVAGVRAVTVDHGAGLETTYSDLAEVAVDVGDRVGEGTWIGRAHSSHGRTSVGLHFGVKMNGRYVDPELYLGAVDTTGAIHLAPTIYAPPQLMGSPFLDAFDHTSPRRSRCIPVTTSLSARPPAPNGNIAIAVAGLGSRTDGELSAAMYEHGPEQLGYSDVYRFSYRGSRGPALHEPYRATDTFVDIRGSVHKLAQLLRAVARRHPGRSVDLIAHSQGGIVARRYLTQAAGSYDERQPQVAHLVTFSSPHTGAPLAAVPARLERDTLTGRSVNDALGRWARSGGPVPDPSARSLQQLAPGSGLMSRLAQEDVLFGTRVLALGIANDGIVPADRALISGEVGRVVGPVGLNGHDAVVESPDALAAAHAWLRDAEPPCAGPWDRIGRSIGRVLSGIESRLPWLYAQLEDKAGGRLVRIGGALGRSLWRGL